MITIVIEGPSGAGKSHAIAFIARRLRSAGCDVTVQSAETHNAATFALTDEVLAERLRREPITILEMRTSA